MPASLNSVLDSLILGFLHLSPDKFTLRVPGPCFPCISLLEILILFWIISLFLTSLKALENNLASLVTIWHERGGTVQSPLCRSISLRYSSVYGHWWVGRSDWKEANPMVLSPNALLLYLNRALGRQEGPLVFCLNYFSHWCSTQTILVCVWQVSIISTCKTFWLLYNPFLWKSWTVHILRISRRWLHDKDPG